MDSSIDKYIKELKSKLNENFFSPSFIRLANLLYVNKQYDECISICKTGLEIYPNYITAKLILLKAFIKAEYLTEAERLFKELRNKIDNRALLSKIEKNITKLKTTTKQEKIYYPESLKSRYDFKSFDKKFEVSSDDDLTIDRFLETGDQGMQENESYLKFKNSFENFKFAPQSGDQSNTIPSSSGPVSANDVFRRSIQPGQSGSGGQEEDFELDKVKIITETLGDILAEQGNYQDAFEAYNFLLRAGTPDSQRIEEKLHELERSMSKEDQS